VKDFFFSPQFPISALILLMCAFLYLGIDGIVWARKKKKEIFLMKSKRPKLNTNENVFEKRELLWKI
jgi:uncharacterized membrane protein YqjE